MIPNVLSHMWAGVAPAVGNHLWQSTLFAVAAGLLTLVLRKNHARTRYWLWLAASLKFLIPFSLLIALGSSLAPPRATSEANPGVYLAMETIGQPFALPTAAPVAPPAGSGAVASSALGLTQVLLHWLPILIGIAWLGGFAVVLATWCARWRRVAAAKRAAVPLLEGREVEALRRIERESGMRKPTPAFLSEGPLEPGIFGIFRPVLLWPQGISSRLDDGQMEAILAHELSHVRRRDNLAAALHTIVEAVFWFYPVVWWMGSRLVAEREQACDEDVVQRGKARQAYAEGILKVCEFCVEAPTACVSGVTGADLKARIRRIMTGRAIHKLDVHRKLLLIAIAAAAILAPLAFGGIGAPQDQASTAMQAVPTFGPEFKYAVASIRPDPVRTPRKGLAWDEPVDGLQMKNFSTMSLVQSAYLQGLGPAGGVRGYSHDEILGAPAWFTTTGYDVVAKIEGPAIEELQKLSRQQQGIARAQMLRELLEERFAIKVHRETREVPAYIMTVVKGGPKFKESTPGETFPNEDQIRARYKILGFPTDFPRGYCEQLREQGHPEVIAARCWMAPMATVTGLFARYLDHQVIDKTGFTGRYDVTLRWSDSTQVETSNPGGASSGPAFAASTPADAPPLSFKTVEKQLGLKLKAGKARLPVIVIDHVERPSEN